MHTHAKFRVYALLFFFPPPPLLGEPFNWNHTSASVFKVYLLGREFLSTPGVDHFRETWGLRALSLQRTSLLRWGATVFTACWSHVKARCQNRLCEVTQLVWLRMCEPSLCAERRLIWQAEAVKIQSASVCFSLAFELECAHVVEVFITFCRWSLTVRSTSTLYKGRCGWG